MFDKVEDVSLLYLGLLLHDIGKGQGSATSPGASRSPNESVAACNYRQLKQEK